jgi:hypothetical protein
MRSFGPLLLGMMSDANETGSTFFVSHDVSAVLVTCNSCK